MEQTKTFVKNEAIKLRDALAHFIDSGAANEHSFELDCETLEDYLSKPVDTSEQFKNLFDKLKCMKGPCIYWVDIVGCSLSNLEVVDTLRRYKMMDVKSRRLTPVVYKKFNDSKTLYVGKVNNLMWVRVFTHMGYHKRNDLQGLQLYHWTKGLNLKISFNIVEFDVSWTTLISPIEYMVAKDKRPLIGSHAL